MEFWMYDIQAQSFGPGPECRKTWAWNVKLKIIYFTNDGASSVYFVSLYTLLYFNIKSTDISRENSVKPPQQKLDASYSSALEKKRESSRGRKGAPPSTIIFFRDFSRFLVINMLCRLLITNISIYISTKKRLVAFQNCSYTSRSTVTKDSSRNA